MHAHADYMRATGKDDASAPTESMGVQVSTALKAKHDEISMIFSSLCNKLDALSNFHYTPKAVSEDVKIIGNTSSIAMEDATPVAKATQSQLAPEEIYAKHSDVKGATEKTDTDRARERRAKKKEKHHRRLEREGREKLLAKVGVGVGVGVGVCGCVCVGGCGCV